MLVFLVLLLAFCTAQTPAKVQVIKWANTTIDKTADVIVLDRMDWKNPNFVDKCGVFKLPTGVPEGKRFVFFNHHRSINILQHQDPLGRVVVPGVVKSTGNAEFWHITLEEADSVVELQWITYNHGWTIIRRVGNVHVQSLRPHTPKYMYTICTFRRMNTTLSPIPAGAIDFVATVDILPESVEYGKIVHIALGFRNASVGGEFDRGEYHHGDLLEIDGRNYLAAPSLNYQNSLIDFFDLTSEKAPTLSSYLTAARTGAAGVEAAAFHTTHLNHQTSDIMISYLGDPAGDSPAGFVSVSPNVAAFNYAAGRDIVIKKHFEIDPPTNNNTAGDPADDYAYDYTMEECHNILVATSWGPPSSFDGGFDPTKPYGRGIRIYKMPQEQASFTRNDATPKLTLIKAFETDPVPGMNGPLTGEGVVPLEVRRTHVPEQQIYFVGITLPGAIDLVWCDIELTGNCNNAADWKKKVIISPAQLAADAVSSLRITNSSTNMPVWPPNFLVPGNFSVPLVTDMTLSEDDQFLYVSCWLAGVVLQYNVSNPQAPVLAGGVANLGGISALFSSPNLNSYEYATMPVSKRWAGGPQMLRLDASGANLYITNSLFSSWDEQFYPSGTQNSISDKGGMLIKIKTGVDKGRVSAVKPMQIDTTFGKGGVVEFSGLTHPSIAGPFKSRAHESHILGVRH